MNHSTLEIFGIKKQTPKGNIPDWFQFEDDYIVELCINIVEDSAYETNLTCLLDETGHLYHWHDEYINLREIKDILRSFGVTGQELKHIYNNTLNK